MQTKRILFINFGGLGDEILFLPTILSVKEQFPDSEITLALEERSRGIINLTNVINHTLFANIKGRGKYIELLKLLFKIWQGKYDMVISSGSNKFISMFLFATFIKEKYGYNTGILSKILLTKAIDLNKNQYAVDMYHDLAKYVTNIRTELPILSIQKKPIIENSVLIHPGVSKISVQKGMIKTIQPEQWAEVVEKLADNGKKVLLAGGPDDKECIETIQKLVPPEKYENLFGQTKNLQELAELISSAEKFLCSDSAPLHIAVALGVKTYVIFGSTDDKKLIPQNENIIPIKADCDCPLQPCLWERRQTTCEDLSCLKIPTEKIVKHII
ncbi:MAG: glycosyltransferase family 9 protein [Candidatus Gastranaerophilales bacterium]|nr:glycosyltransferase family 9 protein [Candidatus Gastranaerophilales bacterium]MCM1072662.1 glycosyltransferase family 9 protein [Bacteroides sp.]